MSQDLEILFLGSGNAFASGRYWSSFLLDGRFLFEASPVVLPHLKQQGVAPEDIDAVFISHFHGDHFFGLPFLLLEYAEMTTRSTDITIVGPPGVQEKVRTVTEEGFPNVSRKQKSYTESFHDLGDSLEGEVAELSFVARSVEHVPELQCFGYRVELRGRTVAYSGDSVMCDALVELADGADVFVVECSCWDGVCGPHLAPGDIRELRRRLGPRPTFLLTHLNAGEQDLGIENTVVANDFLRLTV